jgi:hypothetical protein
MIVSESFVLPSKTSSSSDFSQKSNVQDLLSSSSILTSSQNDFFCMENDCLSTDTVYPKESIVEMLVPVVKCKVEIIFWMIQSNTSVNKFNSLQCLIDEIGQNRSLSIFGHNSNSSFNAFIKYMYDEMKKEVKKKISLYKLYGIVVDDSVDSSHKNQMILLVRYINKDIEIETSFLSLIHLGEKGALSENLFNCVKKVLDEWEMNINDMVSFSSDGANNMSGGITGLYGRLKDLNPSLIQVHCAAHRLNLIMENIFKNEITMSRLQKSKQISQNHFQ